jgi:hypothetical protein
MRANLKLKWQTQDTHDEEWFRRTLEAHHYKIISLAINTGEIVRSIEATLQWEGRQEDAARKPAVLKILQQETKGEVSWMPAAAPF